MDSLFLIIGIILTIISTWTAIMALYAFAPAVLHVSDKSIRSLQISIVLFVVMALIRAFYWDLWTFGRDIVDYYDAGIKLELRIISSVACWFSLRALHHALPDEEKPFWKVWEMPTYPERYWLIKTFFRGRK